MVNFCTELILDINNDLPYVNRQVDIIHKYIK